MMGTKTRSFASLPREISLEELVPEDHFYRRLEQTLYLSFVREMVAPLYARGSPSVDPVVFFKLQLVMFFEDIRSERQLMAVVAACLSLRWYLGYDLHERLSDHSSLIRIRERYGLGTFRRFFERIVEECFEAGLVWGEELFFDATKVEADAAVNSLAPRWFMEAYLRDLFEEDAGGHDKRSAENSQDAEYAEPKDGGTVCGLLPLAGDEVLIRSNGASEDWISRGGAQDRSFKSTSLRDRTADTRASRTDPDATPMRWSENARKLGYRTNYVVDGGKARHPLRAGHPREGLREPPNARPALARRLPVEAEAPPRHSRGHLWDGGEHSRCREIGHPCYPGTARGRRARRLLPQGRVRLRRRKGPLPLPGRANSEGTGRRGGDTQPRQDRHLPGEGFGLRRVLPEAEMHDHKNGRSLRRSPKDEHIDLIRAYQETEPYRRAVRKRKVWIEPLFAEGKLWHGMRRFRMRTLKKVNTEALMTATGQNIKRLLTFGRRGPEKLAQAAALRPPDVLRFDFAYRRSGVHCRKRCLEPTFFNRLVRSGELCGA